MEKKILLCWFFSICMFLNGCSIRSTDSGTPLTRMIITQRGEKSIVVVDLDSTMDIRSYSLPERRAFVKWRKRINISGYQSMGLDRMESTNSFRRVFA